MDIDDVPQIEDLTRDQLLGAVSALRDTIGRLQQQITGYQMHEQTIAAKYRGKISALELELQLAQKGLTSGCGCPIGQCVRKKGDTGSCWLQWAESHLARRIADIRIGELQRFSVHPGRFRQAEQQALESPASDASATNRE